MRGCLAPSVRAASDELALGVLDRGGAGEPADRSDRQEAERQRDREQAAVEQRGDQDRQHEGGERQQDHEDERDDAIAPAAEVAGEDAERAADHHAEGDRHEPDDQRDPGAEDRAREDVAGVLVGTEPEFARIGE